jgi:membrane fusion protein, multidrug efflux system
MSFSSIHKLATVATLFMICVMTSGCMKNAPAQEAAIMPTPEVGVVVIQSEPVVLTTELPGRISSYRVAEIRPQVSGLLQKRLFTEGQDVEAGQVLYQIDPAPFQAEVDNAEARLAVARKTVQRVRASLQASLANITQQQATLDFAKTNRQRFEDLVENGAVSLTERDQAVTNDEVAQAALQSANAQAARDREAIAEAEASIKQAEAVVHSARINLEYTRITAPISGRIGRSNITEGAIVTAYQPIPLSTIQQLDPIFVDVPQSTAELLRLRKRLEKGNLNQESDDHKNVKILLEDGLAYPQEGQLQFRDVTVDPSTGSIVLRIVVPNPQSLLLPGMFVKAVVKEGIKEDAILVPQHAILRDPKGNPFVLYVNAENKVEQRVVTIDRAMGNRWLLASGLASGDSVVVEGSQKVRSGDTVVAVRLDIEQNEDTSAGPTSAPGLSQ